MTNSMKIMKWAIMQDMGLEKPQLQILCRQDGTQLWFESLQEVLDFIKKHSIIIYQNTVVNSFIGTFLHTSYTANQIKDMLVNGIPEPEGV